MHGMSGNQEIGKIMPRIIIQDPYGTYYRIDTMSDVALYAWFDEILPNTYYSASNGVCMWPTIIVQPMRDFISEEYDWITDTRVLGRQHAFPAKNGTEGMAELQKLHAYLKHAKARLDGKA